jgi:DNA-binding NarL/FixJ family response regulator
LGPVRILLVDDFARWRLAVRSILAEDEDLEVVGEASDGLEAVQKCAELQPYLVLLDIQLPKMNGLDAARQIHKVSPDTKILFLSSYCCLEVMQEALRIGAGFVVKADASRDLLPIVRAIIRNEPFVRFKFLFDTPSNPGEM